jgi:hypothetical protein
MVHLIAHPFSISIQKAREKLAYEPLHTMEMGMLEIKKMAG